MLKRGVSPVVATVLLLVLTVVIAGVIYSVVVPFVNEQLGNSKACLNALDSVEFADSQFNCYTSTPADRTGFSVKVKKTGITGVRVALIDSQENSDVFDITDEAIVLGGVVPSIRDIGEDFDADEMLEFPTSAGGQRTYITNQLYTQAEVAPITESGDICAVADVVSFLPCDTGVVL